MKKLETRELEKVTGGVNDELIPYAACGVGIGIGLVFPWVLVGTIIACTPVVAN